MLEHVPVLAAALHAPLLADDPLQIIHDPIGWVQSWLWGAAFGKDETQGTGWLGNLFSATFFYSGLDVPTNCTGTMGDCVYFGLWRAVAAGSGIVTALALLLRMV